MSSCLLTAGVTKQCAHEFGGLKEMYIGNFSEVTAAGLDTDGQITGFTMSTGATFYTFEYVKDTGQALEELQENGPSSFIQQTVNLQLNGITQAKRDVLNELSLGTFVVIVKKADDNYWVFGRPEESIGLEAVTDTVDSGAATGDAAGATLSLVGPSTAYARTASAASVAAVI